MMLRFRAVTVATIAIPPMSFEFEQPSVNAAMEFLCRSIPMMKGAGAAGYDFELFYLPEADEGMLNGVAPTAKLVGRTETHVATRFKKNPHFSLPAQRSEGEIAELAVA